MVNGDHPGLATRETRSMATDASSAQAPDDETLFTWIAQDRRRIADLLDGLDEAQLQQPSLCGVWTVAECAAHLTAGMNASWRKFGMEMLKARGNFDKANIAITDWLAARGAEQTISDLRDQAEHRFTPPGAGPEAPLCDLMVHSEEIFRPLGISQTYDPERVRVVLDQLLDPKFRKAMNGPSVEGVTLEADDVDWSCGSGPAVTGPGHSLVLVLAGRKWALEDLSGPGLSQLGDQF